LKITTSSTEEKKIKSLVDRRWRGFQKQGQCRRRISFQRYYDVGDQRNAVNMSNVTKFNEGILVKLKEFSCCDFDQLARLASARSAVQL